MLYQNSLNKSMLSPRVSWQGEANTVILWRQCMLINCLTISLFPDLRFSDLLKFSLWRNKCRQLILVSNTTILNFTYIIRFVSNEPLFPVLVLRAILLFRGKWESHNNIGKRMRGKCDYFFSSYNIQLKQMFIGQRGEEGDGGELRTINSVLITGSKWTGIESQRTAMSKAFF